MTRTGAKLGHGERDTGGGNYANALLRRSDPCRGPTVEALVEATPQHAAAPSSADRAQIELRPP